MQEFSNLLDLLKNAPSEKKLFFYKAFALEEALSYADVDVQSDSLAAQIAAEIPGLSKKPVLISIDNSPDFLRVFFAVLKLGAYPVPVATESYLSTDYFSELFVHILGVTKPGLVISGSALAKKICTQAEVHCLKPSMFDYLKPLSWNCQAKPDDVALIQFSSGSTNWPKGVMLTHKNILVNLAQISQAMKVTTRDVLSSWLPFYHDMGLLGGLLSPIANRVNAHLMSPLDFLASPKRWIQMVSAKHTSIILGPNFLYRQLINRVPSNEAKSIDLSQIRLALVGSEPIQVELCENLVKHYSGPNGITLDRIFPVYGLAENCLAVAFPRLDRTFVKSDVKPSLISCGYPLPGILIKIVKEDASEAREGEQGEICFSSPSATQGYFKNSEATHALFEGHYVRTGDIGYFNSSQGLFITGRKKEIIIHNGRKFHPSDIEYFLQSHGPRAIGRSAAYQADDDGLRLVVETKVISPRKRNQLKAMIGEKIYRHYLVKPASIHLVAPCVLPRTSSGKLKRTALKDLLSGQILSRHERFFIVDYIRSKTKFMFTAFQYFVDNLFSKKAKISQKDLLLEYLMVSLLDVMGSPKPISSQSSFLEMNLDSLQVLTFNAKLAQDIVDVPLEKFIAFRNLEDVTDFLCKHHPHETQRFLTHRGYNA